MYYGFENNQLEPMNYAQIAHIKLNINNYHEFNIDRSININIGDVILIGINFQNETPTNSYNYLYVGGSFTSVYDINSGTSRTQTSNYFSQFSFSSNQWSKVYSSVNAQVNSIAINNNNTVYIGGRTFADASANNLGNYLVCLDQNYSFTNIVSGTLNPVNGIVSTLYADLSNNAMYIGGTFSQVTNGISSYFYGYNVVYIQNPTSNNDNMLSLLGSTIKNTTPIYQPTSGPVRVLYLDPSYNLITGGNYTTIADIKTPSFSANYIAKMKVHT
jgi:hypothetical protein